EEQARVNRAMGCCTTLFGWDGDTLAWEGHDDQTTHYLYEPGSFVPLAQAISRKPILLHQQPAYAGAYDIDRDPLWISSPDPDPVDAMAWYHCDHLGTPQELTDAQGEIAWSAQYHAWGAAKEAITEAARAAGIRNPIRFQGQYLDQETGLHYNRHRYYDPQIGRFITKDPIGFAGGLNVYQYADNPVGWVDPLGLAVGDGGQTTGRDKALPTGVPESIYTKTDASGKLAVQNTVYNVDGKAIGQVDFKNHGGCACSGHGHILNPPGNFKSAHGQSAVHLAPESVPDGWSTIPEGLIPATPIGK
ncbi:RHS repeat-associated core domain-containing protein, partial [Achromobacter sp. NFACC18-2]|uniref:RHS repeat-associated core domain-containing protein n=1 Tax=Achromobacter sp. NFACC18-2 TaxID=1564112 RepID=UPI0008D1B23B